MVMLMNSTIVRWSMVPALAIVCAPAVALAQTASPGPGTHAPTVLEFEVPDGEAIAAFRIGLFRTQDSSLIRAVDIGRDGLSVRGRTARITLPAEAMAACGGNCSIRIQSVSGTLTSPWSEAVSIVPAGVRRAQASPSEPQRRARAARSSSAPRPRRSTALTPDDVERYPSLSAALRDVLPKDAKLETEVRRFRRVQDLALAVAMSRGYDIPFTTLTKTMQGPPRIAPGEAFAKLRQDVDQPSALRKLRAEARSLTTVPDTGTPPQ